MVQREGPRLGEASGDAIEVGRNDGNVLDSELDIDRVCDSEQCGNEGRREPIW